MVIVCCVFSGMEIRWLPERVAAAGGEGRGENSRGVCV